MAVPHDSFKHSINIKYCRKNKSHYITLILMIRDHHQSDSYSCFNRYYYVTQGTKAATICSRRRAVMPQHLLEGQVHKTLATLTIHLYGLPMEHHWQTFCFRKGLSKSFQKSHHRIQYSGRKCKWYVYQT